MASSAVASPKPTPVGVTGSNRTHCLAADEAADEISDEHSAAGEDDETMDGDEDAGCGIAPAALAVAGGNDGGANAVYASDVCTCTG